MDRLHVYTIAWNEARVLPFFLRHYTQFAQRIVIADNGSDDKTAVIARQHPAVELTTIDSRGELREDVLLAFKNQAWKASRGRARWVIVCDVDEFLVHPDLLRYLDDSNRLGVTLPRTVGWQMVAESFPEASVDLVTAIPNGFPDPAYGKLCLFDPNAITEIGYAPGCHSAQPQGTVIYDADPRLQLRHYKYLGVEFVANRYRQLDQRRGDFNRTQGFGRQYSWSPERLQQEFALWRERARPVADQAVETAPTIWSLAEARRHHRHSPGLAAALTSVLPCSAPVLDLGCGTGRYLQTLQDAGFRCQGVEGTPGIEAVARFSNIVEHDLSQPLTLNWPRSSILCLEVAEHLHPCHEDQLLQTIDQFCVEWLILSWAIPGQPGHGHHNCRTNDYVRNRLAHFGFQEQPAVTARLRAAVDSHTPWFRQTLLAFRRSPNSDPQSATLAFAAPPTETVSSVSLPLSRPGPSI